MIIKQPRPRYPRQGPSCLLLLVFMVVTAAGVYVIANADTVRDVLQPTPTPEPTRSAVDLAISAELYARDGDYAAAIATNIRAVELDPTNIALYRSLIQLLLIEGESAEALDWARQANELAPDNGDIWRLLAGTLLANGDRLLETGSPSEALTTYAEAVRAAREAVALNPEDGVAYAYWAGAIVGQSGVDGIDDAIEKIEFAYALEPEHPEVRIYRALVFEYQGLYTEAIDEYQAAINQTNNPNRLAELYIYMARNSFALRNIPEAILFYEDALVHNDTSADAYDGLSYMYFLVGDYPNAAENAQLAKEYDPEMVRAYAHLGAALYRENNYVPAIENLSFAVDRYEQVTVANSVYFVMLGFAYVFEEQDCSKARPLFEQVLETLPEEPNALEGVDLCRRSG